MKKQQEIVNLTIASGTATGSVRFTPQDGLVTGLAIYKNGGANTGLVTAQLKDDSGNEVAAEVHIDDWRSREAAYNEGMKPAFFETGGRTYLLTINATANFSSDLQVQLVLNYAKDHTNKNC